MNFRRFPTPEGYCLINLDMVTLMRPHPDNDGCILSMMNGTDIVFVDSIEEVYEMMTGKKISDESTDSWN